MHKKILLVSPVDCFAPHDYSQNLVDNTGNSLFRFSIQKMLSDPDVSVDITSVCGLSLDSDMDLINERYDVCVVPSANTLGLHLQKTGELNRRATCLTKAKIPFYFIGMGTQSDRFYSFDFLKTIKKDASRFIGAILDTGGSLGLRGEFTAEAVRKLGFSDPNIVVTGCPSLFMNGSGLRMAKCTVAENDFKPILNGKRFWESQSYHHYFDDYPGSVYICQNNLYSLLYGHTQLSDDSIKHLQGNLFLKLLKGNRIKLYCTYPDWDNGIRMGGYNFSVGSRFHGGVASLHAGIPCFWDAIDSRVRELCEFFHLPFGYLDNPQTDLYEVYQNIDPAPFNKSFDEKYFAFKRFMNERGLPCHENTMYIQQKICSLNVQIPQSSTPVSFLEEMTPKAIRYQMDESKKRAWKQSKAYRLLHFYWLRKLFSANKKYDTVNVR